MHLRETARALYEESLRKEEFSGLDASRSGAYYRPVTVLLGEGL